MFTFNSYRRRKKLEIDIEMQEYRKKMFAELEELALTCAKQTGEYEHEWHSQQEKLGVEIAKLEASKEAMTKDAENLKEIIKIKDQEIGRLMTICAELSKTKIVYCTEKVAK